MKGGRFHRRLTVPLPTRPTRRIMRDAARLARSVEDAMMPGLTDYAALTDLWQRGEIDTATAKEWAKAIWKNSIARPAIATIAKHVVGQLVWKAVLSATKALGRGDLAFVGASPPGAIAQPEDESGS